jgi:predicted RNase H-like nuclease (RuvC/YqgF family)
MSYAEQLERLQALRAQTRALEQQVDLQARSMQPLTLEDERQMADTQSRLDVAYQAANRRAPPPLPLERPSQFRQRLLDGLKVYHDDWRDKDLSRINNAAALDAIEGQLTDAARKRGPTWGLRDGEIKAVEKSSGGGHKIIEFVGTENTSFIQQFKRPAPRAILKTQDEYNRIHTNNLLAKVTQRIPGWARSFVGISS